MRCAQEPIDPAEIRFPPSALALSGLLLVVFGAFTFLYFFNALAPESSPDGMSYHLGVVAKYQRTHGFPRITTDIYASLSEGIELLFLWAFEYGRHSAAALVHFAFFLALTFLILSYARRIGRPAVGVAAAIFFYASPVVGLDGTIAYIDVGITAVLFALFYLLQIWDRERNAKLLIPIGILAGFSYAVKYTAFLAVPYTLGFIAWKLWRTRKPLLRPVLVVSVLALAFMLPWMAKSWIEVANPLSPYANRVFPNPYVHISFEETYRKYMQVYALTSYWQIPWQVTVRGDLTTGLIGPLFLLTPIALLALRFREGRQLLLAGLIFGLPYLTNVGTRFLIPAIPFISLSLGALALSGPGVAPARSGGRSGDLLLAQCRSALLLAGRLAIGEGLSQGGAPDSAARRLPEGQPRVRPCSNDGKLRPDGCQGVRLHATGHCVYLPASFSGL